ncbi:hypothetical protein [Streptomyces sp. NBC_00094]|uniref:hypothetical protein n=1 Tax=Streptomyces sp. NBC_00094 TaxID=2903620 RepID=UPI002251B8B9|nr:hypothetical protein [Streptomyces sp. NBC_00094]MCX5394530.1 hypothetical protein [Streptomyces sp. NBC_00094]
MFTSSKPGAVVVAVALAVLSVACGTSDKNDAGATNAPVGTTAPADPAATTTDAGGAGAPDTTTDPTPDATSDTTPDTTTDATPPSDATPDASGGPTEPVEKVRDAFATLQATLYESCTPDNCAYFLGRVYDELQGLDRAMKEDPKGPGHFPEPIALIAKLNGELDGDRSFENLKKHQSLLVGTRDKINTWMQGHPDDYR